MGYVIGGPIGVTVLASALLVVGIAAVTIAIARNWRTGLLLGLVLSVSPAVVGLAVGTSPGALSSLLVIGAWLAAVRMPMPREIRLAAVLASAALLCDLDTGWVAVPPVLAMSAGLRPRTPAIKALISGVLPLLLWVILSRGGDGGTASVFASGWLERLSAAPLALAVVGVGIGAGLRWGGRIDRALALGLTVGVVLATGASGHPAVSVSSAIAPLAVIAAALAARVVPSTGTRWRVVAAVAIGVGGVVWPGSAWQLPWA
ncbi:MAG: hypothetical protein KC502_11155 [Myxococcales bacterium]|nr:hypothetical protein [Myxococcales bacterium]